MFDSISKQDKETTMTTTKDFNGVEFITDMRVLKDTHDLLDVDHITEVTIDGVKTYQLVAIQSARGAADDASAPSYTCENINEETLIHELEDCNLSEEDVKEALRVLHTYASAERFCSVVYSKDTLPDNEPYLQSRLGGVFVLPNKGVAIRGIKKVEVSGEGKEPYRVIPMTDTLEESIELLHWSHTSHLEG